MMRLLCFTYAGGNADFFDQLEDILGEKISVIKFEYPGHGSRRKEPLKHSIEEIAKDAYLLYGNKYRFEDDFALFGYSMGTLVMVEFIKLLLADGHENGLKYVFVASHEPRSYRKIIGDVEITEDWIKKRIVELGNISDKLQQNTTFWRMYLPLYMADFQSIAKYRFDDLKYKITAPITAMYSESDTSVFDIEGWKRFTDCSFETCKFDGGHFFIREHYEEVAKLIIGKLLDDKSLNRNQMGE